MTLYHVVKPCPVCGRAPDIDECGPAPRGMDLGWYANCYSTSPEEHCVGVNADTKQDAIRMWNAEVERHSAP